MFLIPALDLRAGRVVRLQQGDYARETRYDDDALERALLYQRAGAGLLHLVDLDAARDGGDGNLRAIAAICAELPVPVQTGGGVRGIDDVRRRLDAGAARIVIGSVCVRTPDTVCDWLAEFGPERIVAGLDVRRAPDGRWVPQAAGWTEAGAHDLFTLLDRLGEVGLKHLLCTDIDRDGMLGGASVALYRELQQRYPALAIQASGGIGTEADLETVVESGVSGCIVGRALLEGRGPLSSIGRVFGVER